MLYVIHRSNYIKLINKNRPLNGLEIFKMTTNIQSYTDKILSLSLCDKRVIDPLDKWQSLAYMSQIPFSNLKLSSLPLIFHLPLLL